MSTIKRKPQAVAAIEQALLRCVRTKGVVSRGELSQELDLVQSTIGVYVDRLVHDGYLKETIPAERGLGRPPLLVELNARKGRFIGVDFYAQQLKAIAVDFAQQPLGRVEYDLPAPVTTAMVMEVLLKAIAELIDGRPEDILAIGVATPGYVDSRHGVGLEYHYIPDWKDVPVADTVRQKFGLPVFIENNIRALALAEYWFGQGRGLDQFACLSVRAGIAAGIVAQGELFGGAHHIAGEIGSWRIPMSSLSGNGHGGELNLSSHPTVESLSSLTALTQTAAERIAAGIPTRLTPAAAVPTIDELLEAAKANDSLATDLIERAADVHAWMVQQLERVLDPQRLIVAGPLTESAGYWERLQDACRSFGIQKLTTKVCRSELGRFGGAMGATALAVQYWKPAR